MVSELGRADNMLSTSNRMLSMAAMQNPDTTLLDTGANVYVSAERKDFQTLTKGWIAVSGTAGNVKAQEGILRPNVLRILVGYYMRNLPLKRIVP